MTTVLLTHIECLCGRTAAIPEGGFFPLCGGCGRRMMAPPRKSRIQYVSEPLEIEEAIKRAAKANADEPAYGPIPGHARVYDDEALTAALDAAGFPTEPQPWPLHGSPDGGRYRTPPWEIPRGGVHELAPASKTDLTGFSDGRL